MHKQSLWKQRGIPSCQSAVLCFTETLHLLSHLKRGEGQLSGVHPHVLHLPNNETLTWHGGRSSATLMRSWSDQIPLGLRSVARMTAFSFSSINTAVMFTYKSFNSVQGNCLPSQATSGLILVSKAI